MVGVMVLPLFATVLSPPQGVTETRQGVPRNHLNRKGTGLDQVLRASHVQVLEHLSNRDKPQPWAAWSFQLPGGEGYRNKFSYNAISGLVVIDLYVLIEHLLPVRFGLVPA